MSEKKHRVLIVDDEPDIVEILEYNLKKEGYVTEEAKDGIQAVKQAKAFSPELILMDIMMPGMDGVEACRQIREIPSLKDVYIIFLTARSEEYSEVAAFESGANDYINKPIKPRALLSRINAHFKRSTQDDKDIINIQGLSIDRTSYTVSKNEEPLVLPKKEFEILYFLASRPDKVYSRDQLLSHIWGNDVYVLARTVDVHVRKIREKIGDDYIKTIKGVGYKFAS